MRHSGWGHLRPALLLCLGDSLIWRRKLEVAYSKLPVKSLEHAEHLTGEVVGVLKSGEVGEMEA